MDINWTELLDRIQDLRAQLEVWGVTYEILICLGVSALALFLISLREIVVWYLRLSQLQAQMLQMSKQLSQIQNSVGQVQTSVDQVQAQTQAQPQPQAQSQAAGGRSPVFQDSPPPDDAKKKFTFDH